MTQNAESGTIEAAVERAVQKNETIGIPRMLRRMRAMVRELRARYLAVGGVERREPQDEWLCDNYYVLEKEYKQSRRDIKILRRRAAASELESLYAVVEQVLTEIKPPVCEETLTALLAAVGKKRCVSEDQFAFLAPAIKCVLVRMAYLACMERRGEGWIRYAIVGLGKLMAVEWEEVVRGCSRIEQILMEDPADVYRHMTDESRQYYRQLVSRIAARTRRSEEAVAMEMLEHCRKREGVYSHIGHPILHSPHIAGPRLRRGKWSLALGALIPLALAAAVGIAAGSAAVAALCYLPLWEIIRTPLQQIALAGVDVDFLPRIDLKKIKQKPKTVVLVSTLLPKASELPGLEKRLEQLCFSNSDPDMYYCVLADFKEWDYPTDEKDESQIRAARKMVERLNGRYRGRFMLFLRARTYNRTQKRYSGWERKRGAIIEFARFLKGCEASLHTFAGDRSVLPDIRFLIALDSDTNLLYESAQTLVSAAVHPLNRPIIGKEGVVTEGYGILVPKISADLESAKATPFSRVLTGCGGVTAYDTRDKDFYQDLFGRSIFAGKGLIDVDCFYELMDRRFPENRVLSHDILEGAYLRAGFVSDVEMTDSAPASMVSWLSRLHRWVRGDWQNISFLRGRYRFGGKAWANPIGPLSRYQLFDNLRRSVTPVLSFACLVAAPFAEPLHSLILALTGVLSVTFASLWAAAFSIVTGGFFTLSRKFFTRTLPHTLELTGQAFFFLIMLPAQALFTADAVARSLWRLLVTKRNLLEWTTAAQGELRRVTPTAMIKRYWLPELVGMVYLLFASHSALSLVGLLFALILPVAYYSARPSAPGNHTLSHADRDALISYNAAMWRYYEDFADAKNHFLPPDNIQQSPVYRVAARTSPTNIGMMLLSTLAARDMDFIDTPGLYKRVEQTISTVARLKKWNGNLLNWYDTETLDTLKPEFVSTVDSGNFVCCLVALCEGLREFAAEMPEMRGLIGRIAAIIRDTDLLPFYNRKKRLFSIGYDLEREALSDSYYDFLMSEARLTSYYAVATKLVDKKHWGALSRAMSRSGSYAGAVSWTGTMFEYFMPHLLLPEYEGSLLSEGLLYCLYCHKKRAKEQGVPWGISESAFYAFDNNLNYQYKAHGVQKVGMKRHLDKELVISPYSTFITIPQNPNSSMANLRRLRELGVYGRYGFFEAVDFTGSRVGEGTLAVTRSYMAHHIGMSMVAADNALFDNRMQRRFMQNHYMESAKEFLQEKIAKNTVIYDELKNSDARGEKHERPKIREESRDAFAQAPRCALLSNGEMTEVLTDTGAGYLKLGDVDVTRRSADLLRRAQGVFVLVRSGGATISATPAPFYDKNVRYSVEYQEQSVTYYAKKKDVEIGVRCMVHPTISCMQRQVAVKNTTNQKQLVQVLIYCEPVLSTYGDYSAHPAYSKLFVRARYDEQLRAVVYSRRGRDSAENLFLTAALLGEEDFTFETRRETLMPAPEGLGGLTGFHRREFSGGGGGVPDACCAIKLELNIPAGGQQQFTVLLAVSHTAAEGQQSIVAMRKLGMLDQKSAARLPMQVDSLEGRLGGRMLGQLLFAHRDGGDIEAGRRNNLGQSGLWGMGISGDLPVALFEAAKGYGTDMLDSYLRLHKSLRNLKIEYDLCILYEEDEAREGILAAVERCSVPNILGDRGGVFVLHKGVLAPEALTLLYAVARHLSHLAPADGEEPFRPVKIQASAPAPMPDRAEYAVRGGAFADGCFYVEKPSPLPWSHILTNGPFGTLMSDKALGFTWALNSRENKLTPWYNDICSDNTGEMVLLRAESGVYDLVNGARAAFGPELARWEGKVAELETRVEVSVAARGCAKYIDVTLRNPDSAEQEVRLAYYLEPVLAVNRDTARYIRPETADGALLLHNSYNTAARCWAAVAAPGRRDAVITTVRDDFLAGRWEKSAVRPGGDICAAVIVPVTLPPKGEERVRFVLTYGGTRDSALYMAAHMPKMRTPPVRNRFSVTTPDKGLDMFVNHFAAHQILASRIQGRCAFYQCGGAYGFRDQLQDARAYMLIDPAVTKRQILRCCCAQFEEGDVLHWWHGLPENAGGLRGVRTRFSDDLLWLPLIVGEYVEWTGDTELLRIPARYLRAEPLADGEQEKYITPERSAYKEDVFGHCVRALERGYNVDERGLPRIGCGDWCDGYSAVGAEGRGVSVWLAMFLAMALERFAGVCALRGEEALGQRYRERAGGLRAAVDEHAWDGHWYLRAFYDDGGRMGSHQNRECAIDLLPQSFAALADMPDKARVAEALDSAKARLYDKKLGLVRLFEQPFQYSRQQPGYVKAYPGGIRENGGQYTHAAIWFAMALMKSGRADEGAEILRALSPASRCADEKLAGAYKLEPYYIAADIYTNENAPGRGGWSLYTGAAGWYYRAVLETLFGLTLRGERLEFSPLLPPAWPEMSLNATIRGTKIVMTVRREGEARILCDGERADSILLDGGSHTVEIFVR